MSANLPPSFKPIAHYIKIANENSRRDPVIYYWSPQAMAPVSSAEFNEQRWQRLQETIRIEGQSIETRDTLREFIEIPDEAIKIHQESAELSEEIVIKTFNCEKLREKISEIQEKIKSGQREIEEYNEKLKKKVKNEQELVMKVEHYQQKNRKNREGIFKEKRILNVFTRLGSHRKLFLIKELFDVFQLKIDGGPASNLFAPPRTCQCQVVDSIRGHHLPQISHVFNHPEDQTRAALHCSIHLIQCITKILNFVPKFPCEIMISNLLKPWKKRTEREKVLELFQCLGKNIGELRVACGIPTMATDRPLGTLEEWIRFVMQKNMMVYERPVNSAHSPACLLIDLENF